MSKWTNVVKRLNKRGYSAYEARTVLKTLGDVFITKNSKDVVIITVDNETAGIAVPTAVNNGRTVIYDLRRNWFVLSTVLDFKLKVDPNTPISSGDSLENMGGTESEYRVENIKGFIPLRPMPSAFASNIKFDKTFTRKDDVTVHFSTAKVKYYSMNIDVIIESRGSALLWWMPVDDAMAYFLAALDTRMATADNNRDIITALTMYVKGALEDETYYQWIISEYTVDGLVAAYNNDKPVSSPLGLNADAVGLASHMFGLKIKTQAGVGYGSPYATDDLAKFDFKRHSPKKLAEIEEQTKVARAVGDLLVKGLEECLSI
jgi:hypothetical protein